MTRTLNFTEHNLHDHDSRSLIIEISLNYHSALEYLRTAAFDYKDAGCKEYHCEYKPIE